jgi:YD repeat-containing protein
MQEGQVHNAPPLDPTADLSTVWTYTYDAHGRMTSVIDLAK